MSGPSMPSFSNFSRPVPKNPTPVPIADLQTTTTHDESHHTPQNRGIETDHNRSPPSPQHQHKSERKPKKKHKRQREYEYIDDKTHEELLEADYANISSQTDSTAFTIRRTPNPHIASQGVIHKGDIPAYYKSYQGALGALRPGQIVWSADLRTFTIGNRESPTVLDEKREKKTKFEGRYCAKRAVAHYGTPVRKLSPAELQNAISLDGPNMIRLDTSDAFDNMDANVELDEQQAIEARFLDRNRILSAAVQADPQNVDQWLELVHLQDEFAPLISGSYRKHTSSAGRSSLVILEKKLGIYDKALEHNKSNVDLLVGRLETLQMMKDPKEVNMEWMTLIASRPDCAPLWLAYLQFIQSYFANFSIEHFRTAYNAAIRYLNRAKIKQLDDLLAFELCIADILVKSCKVEFQAGYTERAVAILQAAVEINFFPPDHIVDGFQRLDASPSLASLSTARQLLLSSFQRFWESPVPKFGEDGAKGWKTAFDTSDQLKPSLDIYDPMDIDEKYGSAKSTTHGPDDGHLKVSAGAPIPQHSPALYSATITARTEPPTQHNQKERILEFVHNERLFDTTRAGPLRAEQFTDDVDAVVLFEDIKDTLIYFVHPKVKSFVLNSFFEMCGAAVRMRLPSSSPFHQTRDMELESLEDVFDMLEGCNFPKMASITPHDQLDSPKLPTMFDFLDTHIPKTHRNSKLLQLASNSLITLEDPRLKLSMEARRQHRLCRILIGGELLAKEMLSQDQQDIHLWNAYLRVVVNDPSPSPKRLGFVRRTYGKIIQTFISHPGVVHSILLAAMMEYRSVETDKAMEALLAVPRSTMPPAVHSSSQLRLEEIKWAIMDYSRKLETFENGINHMVSRRVVVEQHQWLDDVLDSLDVYFSLSIILSLLYCLVGDLTAFSMLFETMRQTYWSCARSSNTDISSIAPWYIERAYMYQLDIMATEHSRINSSVPRGVMEQVTKAALDKFPSNRYFLSLIASIGLKSQLIASTRRYFGSKLTTSGISATETTNTGHRLMLWLFNARCETHSGSYSRIKHEFERTLDSQLKVDAHIHQSVLLWKLMMELETRAGRPSDAKHLFFRAVQSCPWSKSLWLELLEQLSGHLTEAETQNVFELMLAKQLRVYAPMIDEI